MKKNRKNVSKYNTLKWTRCWWILIALLVTRLPLETHSQPSSATKTKNKKELYLVIGNIKEAQPMSGSSSPPGPAEVYRDEQVIRMTVYPPLFFKNLIFKQYKTYLIVDGMATNVQKEAKTVLLADRFFKVSPSDKRLLFFGEKYDPPKEFIRENNLKDCLILKLMKEKQYVLEEGTRQFDLELKKYGLTLSLPETNIVSQIPAGTLDGLPINVEAGKAQSDKHAPE